jgi:hypothetical protein
MYFLFLTYKVKYGAVALNIADQQNTHSITLAIKSIIKLFKIVKHKKKLHQKILAFLVSHDHRTIRIYKHYPVINENKTSFYRYTIYTFDFTTLNSKKK